MTKKVIRDIYKKKRLDLGYHQVEKMQDLLLIQFQKLDLPFLNFLHSYLPLDIHKEIDTHHIIEYLKFRNPGMKVVVPRSDFSKNDFVSYIYDENTVLVKNEFNILEPQSGEIVEPALVDLVLVPLLAFDKSGYRVGYGKGFYDKFLSECNPATFKIGLSFFEAVDHIEDTDDFDIPLTHCVTPERVYEF